MKTVSTSLMKDLDFYSINEYEHTLKQMMELAGYKLAKFTVDQIKRLSIDSPKILVLCGSGNNGGGGLVATKNLLNWGIATDFYIHSPSQNQMVSNNTHKMSPVSKTQLSILHSTGNRHLSDIDSTNNYNVILDCLVGYGLKGGLRSELMSLIDSINDKNALRISLDIPSGLNADTGEPRPVAVKADFTLTLAAVKSGLLTKEAKPYVGQLYLADVGIPKRAYEELEITYPFDVLENAASEFSEKTEVLAKPYF